ncbi:hypothetical protein XA68_10178 [Ophiocordyceps unilateralis]|uniref:Brl1/Brr6 domain-containing protein n=1 Tax=Ophiocordyceps unilateralis TaxID=268505 RepID=A0A2A9P344_OPHUN|nr:hypothetical protein XA68_10198 [Ophiocordyceps unilateralis]PFH55285.1 hypothetical protein XA68_10178 [Ophiocordyceps unilateralis]
MESRTSEGPMDWEYQGRGPLDPTSPFSHAARNAQRNLFGSPADSPVRPANPLPTPSKMQQQPPPQAARFTPQLPPRNMAPPFRNPAFSTPRRPFDEVVMSEASGAEDSPAATEVSDYPNDTPEADHRAEAHSAISMTPLKIDKSSRYGKFKKHAPGKGEIRGRRDASVGMRKRKRHNHDRDVGSVNRDYHGHDSEAWDSESESDNGAGGRRIWSRSAKRENQGAFESFFQALNKYPNTPDHMQRWMQFGANLFLVSVLAYLGWSVVSTVRSDIYKANDVARQELVSRMTECQTQYTMNECSKKDRPALRVMCDEWYDCMMQNPESILRVKVTAKQVAEIINEFSETMHLKAWGIVLAFILVCTTVNVGSLNRQGGHKPTAPAPIPQPSSAVADADAARSPGIAPGYMLVPVHTPRVSRRAQLDEGTDTDTSPLNLKAALSQFTPSRHKSPSKQFSAMKNRAPKQW